ncbi:glucosamine-6-phosphate deaminase [Herbiconiux sp. KACC 21604]|uniref:glucosamine-6-phosphate deaminase n=1 Tax=unclassified Herbiconiux TaxID=2618217 RepID=UPI001492D38B|nr:glucosamine-6-phosphate deaminase [Herbiconiux sp. SALV-R1]QJU55756.1 glucosamine-6-phosphate deaminase [Herbiconiux sp. SALV-R1]WPO86964.1 glucosamine-6-phosphate deaminase [Herbiconiux sp. KACC 21604]
MRVSVHPTAEAAAESAAATIAALAARGGLRVLGVATGSSPTPVYRALARRRDELPELQFPDLTLFALDEYLGLPPGHPESYRSVVERDAAGPLGISPDRVHLPSGADPAAYDLAIARHGGVDVQILGIGRNGHIGFNEPGSSFDSRTRVVDLDPSTRLANARFFSGVDEVPSQAVTQGIGTILEARILMLFAFGAEKAEAVAAALEGPVTERVPASALRAHPDVHWVLDDAAASRLSRSGRIEP